jgi:hypothetical protein
MHGGLRDTQHTVNSHLTTCATVPQTYILNIPACLCVISKLVSVLYVTDSTDRSASARLEQPPHLALVNAPNIHGDSQHSAKESPAFPVACSRLVFYSVCVCVCVCE